MRLTVEEHRDAIKRYRHIKPGRGRKTGLCSATCQGIARTCTRAKGHSGPHVAHGFLRNVKAVWDSGSGARVSAQTVRLPSKAAPRRGVGKGRPLGLRDRGPAGILESLRGLCVRALSSFEEIAFVILFLIVVRYAIDWLLLIL